MEKHICKIYFQDISVQLKLVFGSSIGYHCHNIWDSNQLKRYFDLIQLHIFSLKLSVKFTFSIVVAKDFIDTKKYM